MTILVLATLASASCVSNGRSGLGTSSRPTTDATPGVGPCESLFTEGVSADDGGLPALRLPCLGDGPDIELPRLAGRPTLVNLWASWCGPCREEMPLLQDAFEEHGAEVRFLGIVTRDEPSVAIDFASSIGVTYAHVVDADGALLDRLGVPGLPVTLGVDPSGRIIARQIGQMDENELSSLLAELQRSMASG